MTNEELLVRYGAQLMLQAAAKLDAEPKPIIVPASDEPRQSERRLERYACAPTPTLH
jgi:hypothetical protein